MKSKLCNLTDIMITKKISNFLVLLFWFFLGLTLFLFVHSFVANVQNELVREIKPVLGADIRVDKGTPFTQEQKRYMQSLAQEYEGQFSEQISLLTTLTSQDGDVATYTLLGIDGNFPMYGDIARVDGTIVTDSLCDGCVMMEQSLADMFDTNVQIGGEDFIIQDTYSTVPGISAFNPFDGGRSVLMDVTTVSGLSLLGVGSRVEYIVLLQLPREGQIEQAKLAMERSGLFEDMRIEDYLSSTEAIQDRLDNFRAFLGLIVSISIALIFLIVYFLLSQYIAREAVTRKLLYTFGIPKSRLRMIFIISCVLVLLVAIAGSIGVNTLVFKILQSYEITQRFVLPSMSVLISAILGLCVLGSSLGALYVQSKYLSQGSKYSTIGLLLMLYVQFCVIFILFLGSILDGIARGTLIFSVLLLLGMIGWFLLKAIHNTIKKRNIGFAYIDGIRRLIQPGNISVLLFVSLGGSILSLVLVSSVAWSFQKTLRVSGESLPALFLLNVGNDDTNILEEYVDGRYRYQIFSRIAMRISQVNGVPLDEYLLTKSVDSFGSRRFTREYNVTDSILTDPLIAGKRETLPGQMTIDQEFAGELGVGIGDTLEVDVIGRQFILDIVGVRGRSEQVGPFFYFNVNQEEFAGAPKTFFVAIYDQLTKGQQAELIATVGPHISVIATGDIFETIATITNKFLQVIMVLTIMATLFALSFLFLLGRQASVQQQETLRLYTIFGASKKYIRSYVAVQWIVLLGLVFGMVMIITGGLLLILQGQRRYLEIDRPVTFVSWISIFALVSGLFIIFVKRFQLRHR